MPLFQTNDQVILQRHKCIARIRERQINSLEQYIGRPSSTNTALLIDPAYHDNVGDHMITVGEHELLRRLGWNVDFYEKRHTDNLRKVAATPAFYQECHYSQANNFVPHCEETINQGSAVRNEITQKTAVWHGGGNWGDLWPHIQRLRIEQSFRALTKNNYSILGMPQSLYYRHKESEVYDSRLMKRELRVGAAMRDRNGSTRAGNSSVVLAWREYESYHRAQQLYPYVKNILVPDIGFQLGPYDHHAYRPKPPRIQADFLFLLRRDHESTFVPALSAEPEDPDDDEAAIPAQHNISQILNDVVESAMEGADLTKSYSHQTVDWPDRFHFFPSEDPFFSKTSIQLLSMGQVLICDRLHAAILAFLSGIPFVYLDQSTGKISKSLKIAFDTWKGCRPRGDQDTTIEALRFSSASNLKEAIEIGAQLLRLSS